MKSFPATQWTAVGTGRTYGRTMPATSMELQVRARSGCYEAFDTLAVSAKGATGRPLSNGHYFARLVITDGHGHTALERTNEIVVLK